jgi:hypothetical protein
MKNWEAIGTSQDYWRSEMAKCDFKPPMSSGKIPSIDFNKLERLNPDYETSSLVLLKTETKLEY